MRSLLLIPLAAVAVGAAGCGSPPSNSEAGQVPRRDLTLQQADAPPVQVASPVELARAVPAEHRIAVRARKLHRTARSDTPSCAPPAPAIVDAAASTPAAAAAAPAMPASYQPPDPYALAPGQTVTVLPASGGTGAAPSSTDDSPPDAQRGDSRGVTIRRGGHGGSCGGRGGHPGGSPGFRGLR